MHAHVLHKHTCMHTDQRAQCICIAPWVPEGRRGCNGSLWPLHSGSRGFLVCSPFGSHRELPADVSLCTHGACWPALGCPRGGSRGNQQQQNPLQKCTNHSHAFDSDIAHVRASACLNNFEMLTPISTSPHPAGNTEEPNPSIIHLPGSRRVLQLSGTQPRYRAVPSNVGTANLLKNKNTIQNSHTLCRHATESQHAEPPSKQRNCPTAAWTSVHGSPSANPLHHCMVAPRPLLHQNLHDRHVCTPGCPCLCL